MLTLVPPIREEASVPFSFDRIGFLIFPLNSTVSMDRAAWRNCPHLSSCFGVPSWPGSIFPCTKSCFSSNASPSSVSEEGVRKRWSIGYGLKICFLAESIPFVTPILGIRKRKRGKDKIFGGSTATSDGMNVFFFILFQFYHPYLGPFLFFFFFAFIGGWLFYICNMEEIMVWHECVQFFLILIFFLASLGRVAGG